MGAMKLQDFFLDDISNTHFSLTATSHGPAKDVTQCF